MATRTATNSTAGAATKMPGPVTAEGDGQHHDQADEHHLASRGALGPDRVRAAVGRQDQPQQRVQREARAAEEAQDHEADPHQRRVEPEVAGQPGRDAADHAVVARAGEAARGRRGRFGGRRLRDRGRVLGSHRGHMVRSRGPAHHWEWPLGCPGGAPTCTARMPASARLLRLLRHQPQRAERRQRDLGRERLAVPGDRLGVDAAEVAHVRAAVVGSASVLTSLAPAARRAAARCGSRGAAPARGCATNTTTRSESFVRRANANTLSSASLASIHQKPAPSKSHLPQRRLVAVGVVEVAHERLDAGVLAGSRAGASRASAPRSTPPPGANSWPMNSSFLPGCAHM